LNAIPYPLHSGTQPRTARLISLSSWLLLVYGDDAPTLETARRWTRLGLISPAPVRHGRSYYVQPDATYLSPPLSVEK